MATSPYEALVQSASALQDATTLSSLDEESIGQASDYFDANRAHLDAARGLLPEKCSVPLRYDDSFFAEHCDHVSHLRNLARAFRGEALLAASHLHFDNAAQICGDILDLGNAVRRGGLMTDLLIGISFSGMAMATLRRYRVKLSAAGRRRMIHELQRIEEETEPFERVVQRDHQWELIVHSGDASQGGIA